MAVTFEDYIYNCYNEGQGLTTQFRGLYSNLPNMRETLPFKYIKIDLTANVIEIPCAYKYMVTETIKINIDNNSPYNSVYIPLMCLDKDNVEAKSANPLLKTFFYEMNGHLNLCRKKGSGTMYLGGHGIIFYEDYTPLVMLTMEIEKTVTVNGETKYIPKRQIVRINPIIYSKDDLLAKHIRTKFLTNIFDMKLSPADYAWGYRSSRYKLKNPYSLFTTTEILYDFKVIIEDFSDFFYTPAVPDITFDNNEVNKLLLNNIDDIMNNAV